MTYSMLIEKFLLDSHIDLKSLLAQVEELLA
jgi:hypothetical protein